MIHFRLDIWVLDMHPYKFLLVQLQHKKVSLIYTPKPFVEYLYLLFRARNIKQKVQLLY